MGVEDYKLFLDYFLQNPPLASIYPTTNEKKG